NPILNSISGFETLQNASTLYFDGNTELENIEAFINLSHISEIFITNNSNINNLNFLLNLEEIYEVFIFRYNPMLSICSIPAICEHIISGGEHYVSWNALGCTTTQEILDNCNLSTNENQLEEFSIYPNPVNDILYIETTYLHTISSIEIYNNLGQLIKWELNKNYVNCSDIPTGLYFLNLTLKDGLQKTLK